MTFKRTIIIIMTLVLLTSQAAGCAKIESEQSTTQKVFKSSNEINKQREQQEIQFSKDSKIAEQNNISTGTSQTIGTTEDGKAYGNGWMEVGKNEAPINGDQKLKSGLTVDEAAKLIENMKNSLTGKVSQDKIDDALNEATKALGISLDDVNRYLASKPAPAPTVSQDTKSSSNSNGTTQQSGSTQQSGTTQSGTTYTKQVGVPGTFPPTQSDKNGNGIDDVFDNSYTKPDGVGGYDPHVEITDNW